MLLSFSFWFHFIFYFCCPFSVFFAKFSWKINPKILLNPLINFNYHEGNLNYFMRPVSNLQPLKVRNCLFIFFWSCNPFLDISFNFYFLLRAILSDTLSTLDVLRTCFYRNFSNFLGHLTFRKSFSVFLTVVYRKIGVFKHPKMLVCGVMC